jgi:hypothetical protein
MRANAIGWEPTLERYDGQFNASRAASAPSLQTDSPVPRAGYFMVGYPSLGVTSPQRGGINDSKH